ncbi:MoaD/ThiS family protein [Saccharothrix longispora]|uniref:Molybdopterin converting factor small subunit n=1 Tax=Saccharothrix longispora TaxID=33920 RepID=A0ABU1Q4N2_9PSEU|nr:MoaD/ThiS family protein [Saccharothrix longispora]MDR6597860.1 molybdopterin converting factor small subunit [Saccharothrix longispora]
MREDGAVESGPVEDNPVEDGAVEDCAVAALAVRYFAGARAAAGVDGEEVGLPGGEPTVRAAVAVLAARHGGRLARVLPACSYLLDGVAVRNLDTPVSPGSQLDVLPPFAGG